MGEIIFDTQYKDHLYTEAEKSRFMAAYPFPVCDKDLYEKLHSLDPRLVDPLWRLNNLYHIIDKNGKLVRFRLTKLQFKFLSRLHKRNIFLKARQLGITTTIELFLFDFTIFNSFKSVGMLAHTQPDAKVIFKKIKLAWEMFPDTIKDLLNLSTLSDSKSELELSNSSIFRVATSLRSGTYNAVHISELGKTSAQFPEKAEEIITGTFPTVEKGILFIESTAEGDQGCFYELCQSSMETMKKNLPLTEKDFRFFFIPWFENPEYAIKANIEIDEKTLEYLDKLEHDNHLVLSPEQRTWYFLERRTQRDKMVQEFPSTPEEAFGSSGNKMYDPETIERAKTFCTTPVFVAPFGLKIFKNFIRGHIYAVGADPSEGVQRDSSAAVVIDFTEGEVVATYKNDSIDQIAFAHILLQIGTLYGVCLIAVESNRGLACLNELNQIYTNVYKQMRLGYAENKPTEKLGWHSNGASRPKMHWELKEAVAEQTLHVLDVNILDEAHKYNKDDSISASTKTTTRHFDLLTSTAICWQMRFQAEQTKQVNQQQEFFEMRRAAMAPRRANTFI
jgi:hypothetical protein